MGTAFHNRTPPPFPHEIVDLTDDLSVSSLMKSFAPNVIVHSAAMSKVAECEDHPEAARNLNVAATARLVRWAQRLSAKFIFLSSDQVFDGLKGGYRESDAPHPISEYGLTKLEAEHLIFTSETKSLVVRSNNIVGKSIGWGECFTDWVVKRMRSGQSVPLFRDQYRSPIHIRALEDLLVEACLSDITGLIHAGGPRRMSRLDIGYAVCRAYGFSPELIADESYRSHSHQNVMTPDTSYDISHLRQIVPQLIQKNLDEEFILDAAEDMPRL